MSLLLAAFFGWVAQQDGGTKGISKEEYTSPQARKGLQRKQERITLSDLYWETTYMFYVIQSILGVVGIIAFSYFVVWYG